MQCAMAPLPCLALPCPAPACPSHTTAHLPCPLCFSFCPSASLLRFFTLSASNGQRVIHLFSFPLSRFLLSLPLLLPFPSSSFQQLVFTANLQFSRAKILDRMIQRVLLQLLIRSPMQSSSFCLSLPSLYSLPFPFHLFPFP